MLMVANLQFCPSLGLSGFCSMAHTVLNDGRHLSLLLQPTLFWSAAALLLLVSGPACVVSGGREILDCVVQ